jgi:hypothetical protein
MGGEVLAPELLDRQVVPADELDPDLDEVAGGLRAQVDEVLLEAGLPELSGVAGLEENPEVVAQVELFEVAALDGLSRRERDDARLAQQDLERKLVHGRTVGDEVKGGVHVGPGVGPEGELAHVVRLPPVDPMAELHLEVGVAGKRGNLRRQRHGHVDHLGHMD